MNDWQARIHTSVNETLFKPFSTPKCCQIKSLLLNATYFHRQGLVNLIWLQVTLKGESPQTCENTRVRLGLVVKANWNLKLLNWDAKAIWGENFQSRCQIILSITFIDSSPFMSKFEKPAHTFSYTKNWFAGDMGLNFSCKKRLLMLPLRVR